MKKYLVFLLSVLMVLGTVGLVVADDGGMDSVRAMKPGAKVMIGGDARVRGIWMKNTDFDGSDTSENDTRKYDQRIRLKFKGDAGNGISGNLRLYITNSPDWDGTSETNCTGCILVDWAYITIPVSTLTVDAGLQKMWFGNAFYLGDDRYDVLQVSGSASDIQFTAFTRKIDDTSVGVVVTGDDNLKDFNDYGATLVANMNDIEAGAILVYHHDNRAELGDCGDPTTSRVGCKGLDVSLFANATVSGIGVGGELTFLTGEINKSPEDKTPLGLMLYAKTTVGAIGVRADFGLSMNTFTANDNYVPSLLIGTDQNTAITNFFSFDDKTAWLVAVSANTDVMEDVNVLGRVAYWSAKDAADDANSLLELDGEVSVQLAKNAKYVIEAAYGKANDELAAAINGGTENDGAIVLANRAELYF